MKYIYIYIYIITEITQFTGQEKLQKKKFKIKCNIIILRDLTFVIDRVARKPNRS